MVFNSKTQTSQTRHTAIVPQMVLTLYLQVIFLVLVKTLALQFSIGGAVCALKSISSTQSLPAIPQHHPGTETFLHTLP